jgi:hypothetical protein
VRYVATINRRRCAILKATRRRIIPIGCEIICSRSGSHPAARSRQAVRSRGDSQMSAHATLRQFALHSETLTVPTACARFLEASPIGFSLLVRRGSRKHERAPSSWRRARRACFAGFSRNVGRGGSPQAGAQA